MNERRQQRVAEEIKRRASQFIREELKDPRLGFLTITGVDVNSDLTHATLHVSVLGDESEQEQTMQALMFNRKLWTIFLSEAMRDSNPQPIDVRQKIANISVFVLSQTAALQMSPQFDHFRPLIEINRNIAAGLSGRP